MTMPPSALAPGADLTDKSALELRALLSGGEVTAEALAAQFLEVIRRRDPQVRAFLHVDEEQALAQARAVDRRRRAGEPLGLLAGLPVAIKDILCTRGQPTTCGSRMLADYRPPYDAHAIIRLRQADAVLVGKTNMD